MLQNSKRFPVPGITVSYDRTDGEKLARLFKGKLMREDKHNLERFIRRQESSYDTAYRELSEGSKRSHWMWWIFPQIVGLGKSWMT